MINQKLETFYLRKIGYLLKIFFLGATNIKWLFNGKEIDENR
jgi:hypothetical protein